MKRVFITLLVLSMFLLSGVAEGHEEGESGYRLTIVMEKTDRDIDGKTEIAATNTDSLPPLSLQEASFLFMKYCSYLEYHPQKGKDVPEIKPAGKFSRIPAEGLEAIITILMVVEEKGAEGIGKIFESAEWSDYETPTNPVDFGKVTSAMGNSLDLDKVEQGIRVPGKVSENVENIFKLAFQSQAGITSKRTRYDYRIFLKLIAADISQALDTIDELVASFKYQDGNVYPLTGGNITDELKTLRKDVVKKIFKEFDSLLTDYYSKDHKYRKAFNTMLPDEPDVEGKKSIERYMLPISDLDEGDLNGSTLPGRFVSQVTIDVRKIRDMVKEIRLDEKHLMQAPHLSYRRYIRDDSPHMGQVHTGNIKLAQFFSPYLSQVFPEIVLTGDLLFPVERKTKELVAAQSRVGQADPDPPDPPKFKEIWIRGTLLNLLGSDNMRGELLYTQNPLYHEFKAFGISYTPDTGLHSDILLTGYFAHRNEWLLTANASYVIPEYRDILLYGEYEFWTEKERHEGEIGLRWRMGDGQYLFAALQNRLDENTFIVGFSGFLDDKIVKEANTLLGL